MRLTELLDFDSNVFDASFSDMSQNRRSKFDDTVRKIENCLSNNDFKAAFDESLCQRNNNPLKQEYGFLLGITCLFFNKIDKEKWGLPDLKTARRELTSQNTRSRKDPDLDLYNFKKYWKNFAIKAFEDAAEKTMGKKSCKEGAAMYFYLCELYLSCGRYVDAHSAIQKTLRLIGDKNTDTVLYLDAIIYKSLGHEQECVDRLNNLIADASTSTQVKYQSILEKASVQLKSSNYRFSNVINTLNTALRLKVSTKDLALCNFRIGECYRKEPGKDTKAKIRNQESAIKFYERALRLEKQADDCCGERLAKYYRACAKAHAILYGIYESDQDKRISKNNMNTHFDKAIAIYNQKPGSALWLHTIEEKAQYFTMSRGFDLASKLMQSPEMIELENIVYQKKAKQKSFLSERYRISAGNTPKLYILQHWNSYTPIIPDSASDSKGGGYFIDAGDCGVAIDPGFDFIKNFHDAGFLFNEIDYVFITHAHNDHTADLESVLSLLDKYNKGIKGDRYSNEDSDSIFSQLIDEYPDEQESTIEKICDEEHSSSIRRKRITLVMTLSTYKKFSSILSLRKSSDYDIKIIRANSDETITCGNLGMKVKALASKHDDLISDKESIGLVFSFPNCCLVYTGDTGWSKDIEGTYKKIGDSRENKPPTSDFDVGSKKLILLAHIGGFKQSEHYRFRVRRADPSAYYPQHLGRLGVADITEEMKPDLCVVSEFGEEMMGARQQLCDLYSRESSGLRYIPADVGFCVTLDSRMKIGIKHDDNKLMLTNEFVDFYCIDNIEVIEESNDPYIKYKKKAGG